MRAQVAGLEHLQAALDAPRYQCEHGDRDQAAHEDRLAARDRRPKVLHARAHARQEQYRRELEEHAEDRAVVWSVSRGQDGGSLAQGAARIPISRGILANIWRAIPA